MGSLGTTLFTSATWYNYVLGAVMILDALYNVLILFVHPAFKDGSRKITDDPTQAYTSGESVCFSNSNHPFSCLGAHQYHEEQSRPCSEDAGWSLEVGCLSILY